MTQHTLPCLLCQQPGQMVGCDAKGRALYRCVAADCPVIDYDQDVVRSREGVVVYRRPRPTRPARYTPKYWKRGTPTDETQG